MAYETFIRPIVESSSTVGCPFSYRDLTHIKVNLLDLFSVDTTMSVLAVIFPRRYRGETNGDDAFIRSPARLTL